MGVEEKRREERLRTGGGGRFEGEGWGGGVVMEAWTRAQRDMIWQCGENLRGMGYVFCVCEFYANCAP